MANSVSVWTPIIQCHHKNLKMVELAHKLSDTKYFSKLDAKNGYWSNKLDTESQLLAIFNYSFGRYCLQTMSFGLVMFQKLFQQKMDRIMEKYPGTSGLIDDVIVNDKTKEEYDRTLYNLMKISPVEGLRVNSEKCTIDQK